jgi:GNAT superfamily N-acetyltransferase
MPILRRREPRGDALERFNPNHDPHSGEFAEGGGDGGGGEGLEKPGAAGARSMGKTNPSEFVAARDQNTRSYFLSSKTTDELKDDRLFLSGDRHSGYALDPHGDLQNLFNNGPKGGGRIALLDAVKNGATTLDAFDGHLPALYTQHGFVATGRMKFNDDYAPQGWDYGKYGRPDIVFMAYQGGDRASIDQRAGSFKAYDRTQGDYFTDYDLAKAASRGAVVDKRAQPGVSGFDHARAQHRRRGQLREELADASHRSAKSGKRFRLEHRYSEDEPRDESGRWTDGGGSEGGGDDDKPAGDKPSGDKGAKGKVSKVSDFDKKGIRLDHDTTLNGAKAEKFLKAWNERVQEAPEDFKKDFIGVPGTMNISYDDHAEKLNVSGQVLDRLGHGIGEYQRQIDLKNNSAYSAYFVMHRDERGGGIGKTLLKSNVAMYQKMGIDKVRVSANIDVGGYAWAKYGYVPTAESWRSLSSDIQDKLSEQGARNSHAASGAGYTPEEWDAINPHDQSQIETAWMRYTRSEFEDSEIQNWRDSGQALDDAKRDLAGNDPRDEDWAQAALKTWRDGLKDEGASIPYSNEQLLAAVSIEEYESRYSDGGSDPEITIDDSKLADPSQPTLPGIPEAPPLTDETREQITDALVSGFNHQAEGDAQDMDPPRHITENVSEYQGEVWDSMDSEDRYAWANRNGELPEYPLEDEDAPEPVEITDPQRDALVKLAESSDPKALWAIADSAKGKDLLLGTSWSGVLDLKDKQTMDRFNSYVGK